VSNPRPVARVLIVDADPNKLAVLKAALTHAAYHVTSATSASFALTTLERDRPDLIVSGNRTEDMDGVEFCSIIRSNPITHDIPFLLLSIIATVIASQAMISGMFSIVYQGIATRIMPMFKVDYTSEERHSQIYIGFVNWFLLFSVLFIIMQFRESSRLAAAYGLAVTGTMTLTGIFMTWIFYLKRKFGRAALSVVVEPDFFHGSWDLLRRCKAACGLPAVAKDFVVSERQLDEARAAGADVILLIAALYSPPELRAWAAAARFSRRVSIHFTARPARRARAATARSSGITCIFCPKPPPVSGTMTRTRASGTPKARATPVRKTCGTWLPVQSVSEPPSQRAITPRPSSGAAEPRAWVNVSRITTAAAAKAPSTSPWLLRRSKSTLEPCSGWSRGARGSRAVSTSGTAGSGSYSTSTRAPPSAAA